MGNVAMTMVAMRTVSAGGIKSMAEPTTVISVTVAESISWRRVYCMVHISLRFM